MALGRNTSRDRAGTVTDLDTIQPPQPPAVPAAGGAPAPVSPEVAARVRDAVEDIPSDSGDGAEGIITALLAAATIEDLNAPWEASSGRDLAGKRLRIESVTRRASQYEDGAGVFLVVTGTDLGTGEKTVFTTSALSVVIQLARAWQLGLFPLVADVVAADRPTERGYYPYHLRIVAAGGAR